jgi:transposase
LLEAARKRTKPRTVDLHEVFNAVLYVLKSGCQWRMIPDGSPKWVTVYDAYFAKWNAPNQDGVSALERAFKKIGWRGPHRTELQHCGQLTQEHQMKAIQRWEEFVRAQKIAAAERNSRTVSLAVQ